jgi:hypothetical protein
MSFFNKTLNSISSLASDAVSSGLHKASDTIIHGKDIANSTIIKNGLNIFIKDFGEIENLKIDTRAKTITLELSLKGENQLVNVQILDYKFLKNNETTEYFFQVLDIEANRYWIDAILKSFVINREFKVPSELVLPLKIIM